MYVEPYKQKLVFVFIFTNILTDVFHKITGEILLSVFSRRFFFLFRIGTWRLGFEFHIKPTKLTQF